MKTLMVSYNCGISYYPELKSKDLEGLKNRTKKLDDEQLRWYIEEEDGSMNHEVISKIHKGIKDFLVKMNR